MGRYRNVFVWYTKCINNSVFVQKIEEDKQPILRVYVPNSSLNQYSTVNKATPRSTKKAAQSQRIMGFHI